MFGHQDSEAPQDDQQTPAPDGALDNNDNGGAPAAPVDDNQGGTMQSDNNDSGYLMDDGAPQPSGDNPAIQDTPAATPAGNDDLVNIKQHALQQLSPLLGHLDQTPEEKFRTTMMLIQATDDSSLLQTAYDAAQQINDEKAKAQALLDVINEINYFTQQQQQDQAA